MKKTVILLSALATSTMTIPAISNAQNSYPTFPTKPDNAIFSELPEEEQQAYILSIEAYKTALDTAYQNGEYDWDFNLDGVSEPFDVRFLLEYYAETSTKTKNDTFIYFTDYKKGEYILCEFTDEMRARIAEDGDVNGDGMIRADDASYILHAMYSQNQQGDVNTDGKLDARDASKLLSFYSANSVNIQSDYVTEYLGDLNGDGKTDAKDASDILAIYAANSTQPYDESKTVWTETEPGEQVEISSVYKIFDRDNYLNQTSLIFDGTVTDIKEYAVSGQYENGEKWGPSNRTIIEVTVNDVYYGETDKKTIKFFYNTSLSRHSKGSFTIETGREYVFMAKELDDNAIQNLDAAKYADLTITAGLRDGIMPVSDGIVSVYHEYFDDNETAKAEALAKDEVMDKLTDDAKAANWFMYFNKADFVELFSELFSS